jgi:hypothetical protein
MPSAEAETRIGIFDRRFGDLAIDLPVKDQTSVAREASSVAREEIVDH